MNKFISGLAIAALSLGAIDRASAQPPTAPTPAPTVTPKPNLPNPPTPTTKPATEKSIEQRVDVNLLTKALRLFWQSDRCQFESETLFNGSNSSETIVKGMGLIALTTVEPTTGAIEQIKLFGNYIGTDFTMTENIRSRIHNVSITARTFKFMPPKGVKRVKSIPINMFGSK